MMTRIRGLEEELQARIIAGEDVHQINRELLSERKLLDLKLGQLDAALRDREKQLTEQTARAKELAVNLHLEQEGTAKLKAEREALDAELRGLREDLAIMRQSQSQSSDAV